MFPVSAEVVKVEDIASIMTHGVMSTPAQFTAARG